MMCDNAINTPNTLNEDISSEHALANEDKAAFKHNKWLLSNSSSLSHAKLLEKASSDIEEHYDKENESNVSLRRSYVKENLRKIFMSIAKYSSKDNSYYITQQILNKLLKDSRVIAECSIGLSEVDLVFQKACLGDKRMTYEQFLNFLIRLSKKLFPEEFYENPKGTVDLFLIDFFERYNDLLSPKTMRCEDISSGTPLYKSISCLLRYKPDSKQKSIIQKVYPTLKELYKQYIYCDIDYIDKLNGSKQFFRNSIKQFTKDFELMPYVISETFFVTYFNMIVDSNEKEQDEDSEKPCKVIDASYDNGAYFSMDNFCMLLIHLSLLSYNKVASYGGKASEASKLLLFLERMDNSKGMQQFINRLSRPGSMKYTLRPSNQLINDLNEEDGDKNGMDSPHEQSVIRVNANVGSSGELIDINEMQTHMEGSLSDLIEKHMVELSRTFLYFCHKGDPLNYNRMPLSCFIKFLKHCKLYREKHQLAKAHQYTPRYYTLNKDQETLDKNKHQSLAKTSIGLSIDHKEESLTIKPRHKDVDSKELTEQLKESDVNIIFSTITRPKQLDTTLTQSTSQFSLSNSSPFMSSGKSKSDIKLLRMSFAQFIESFAYIAHRLFPNDHSNASLSKILSNSIIPNLLQDEDGHGNHLYSPSIESAFNQIKRKEVRFFLESLGEAVGPLFAFYADSRRLVSFDLFFNFYKDFGLYPEMINVTQLKNIFFVFNEMDCLKGKTQMKEEISYANLLDSIGITAMAFDFKRECSDVAKMIYVVERMNQSDGVAKLKNRFKRALIDSNAIISFLLKMKREYPGQCSIEQINSHQKAKPEETIGFSDVYEDEREEFK